MAYFTGAPVYGYTHELVSLTRRAESGRLVRNLWSAPIPRLPDSDTLVPRVPDGLNDLARWATVVTSSSSDRTRGHDLFCVASDPPSLCVFRVHGYIKECDFRPFGNWNS
jgi:hypothetical protein